MIAIRCAPKRRLDFPIEHGRFLLVIVAASAWSAASAVAEDEHAHGVRAPAGFDVQLFADDDLASNVYSLTVDAAGRVVVSGRGYVRILEDQDQDGVADQVRQFADGPANGAMGMYWDGPDLICTGDAGVLRYRDADGDDRADGPPELLLAAKTGSEHDVHAIRKGPDGWWYLIGGNNAGLDERYVTLPTSPVTSPSAGAIVRIAPDFSGSEVLADGFRNAYDFDFNAAGRLFTFDSDGERDVSLPWYRPTRVFEVLPGGHAGWFSRSWKRPGYFLDMPPVVAAFGRGSPTGVVCYRHTQFPDRYRGGLFVLDWTYGRVMYVPPVDAASQPSREPEEFLTGVGSFGFAPTDAAVGPGGELYVSVGGRGSRGGVYRVRWSDGKTALPDEPPLERCLRAPQPLSSWSRAQWEPLLLELTPRQLQAAAQDDQRPDAERVRAIEILCEYYAGLEKGTAQQLLGSRSSAVRARAAWCLGRQEETEQLSLLGQTLGDDDVSVSRAAAEAVLENTPLGDAATAAIDPASLVPALSSSHRPTIQATARILARLSADELVLLAGRTDPADADAQLTLAYGSILRGGAERRAALNDLLSSPFDKVWASRPLESVRLLQLALGDVGPGEHDPAFDGYTVAASFLPESLRDQVLRHAGLTAFPSGQAVLDRERARVFAMLQPNDPAILADVLGQVTAESHPVDDVHYLIVAARLPASRTDSQTAHVASCLLSLDDKIRRLGLHQDRNWDVRVGETHAALVGHDPRLPEAIVRHERFGEPGHVLFVEQASEPLRQKAVDTFVRVIGGDPDFRWNNEIVRLLSASDRDDVRELLKAQAEEFAVRESVLTVLAKQPRSDERELFVAGLESSDLGVLRQMASALEQLGPDDSAAEQVALIRTLRRLGDGDVESRLSELIVRTLRQNTGVTLSQQTESSKSATPGPSRAQQWSDWIAREHPDVWAAQTGTTVADAEQLQELLADVDWTQGNAQRGATLFEKRSCAQCHGGGRALGPDLRGAAGRFSREDLFTAIVSPNRDVSPRYQTTLIVTDQGQTHTGIVIYESIDGMLLRNGRGETIRIEASEIDVRRQVTTSLMPAGLLKDLDSSDLADLYAYLKTLR